MQCRALVLPFLVGAVIAVGPKVAGQGGPTPVCNIKGEPESCCAHFASRMVWCIMIQQWCPYQMLSDSTIHLGDWGSPGYSTPLAQDPSLHYCTYYAALCPRSSNGFCMTAYPVQSKFRCGSLIEPPTPMDCPGTP